MLTIKPSPLRLTPEARCGLLDRAQTSTKLLQVSEQAEAVVENRIHKRKIPNLADEPEFLDRLHRVEKHIRKNNLRATFSEQLGRTGALDDVASLNEAHQLAFFLFWNIKPHFERCG